MLGLLAVEETGAPGFLDGRGGQNIAEPDGRGVRVAALARACFVLLTLRATVMSSLPAVMCAL